MSSVEAAKKEYKTLRNSKWFASVFVRVISTTVLAAWGRAPPAEILAPSLTFQDCLNDVCNGRIDCVRYPGVSSNADFFDWARPYNRAHPVVPAAVVRPKNALGVSGFVKCAVDHNVKVQARSGGHSYANYGLGGEDGALSIDLQELRYVIVDEQSWHATIGGGSLIGDIDDLLDKKGGRAFSHGVCPGVGIGGHATVGGLGPSSRMWGTALDHVLEVEVVTADGSIVRASETQNEDLFFAMRGAGASFGIVTEFIVRTHEKPKTTLHLTHRTPYSKSDEIIHQFQAWQELIVDPTLDRRFGTEFTLEPEGSKITATWFGTKAEFESSGIASKLPRNLAIAESSWIETYRWQIENAQLVLADIPTEFYSRSLGLTNHDPLSKNATKSLIEMIKQNKSRSQFKWFVIFDATGGKVSDFAMNSTAFAHRDKVMFYQSYAYNICNALSHSEIGFLDDVHQVILDDIPSGSHTTYPGYVDPKLSSPQNMYWGSNLCRLQELKTQWDPKDVFHNPQSIRPLVAAS